MQQITDLGMSLRFADYSDILELINKASNSSDYFCHIVSLNPETCLDMLWNKEYRKVVAKAQFVIADGRGVVAAVRMLYGVEVPHVTGTDLMERVLMSLPEERLTICFIGGKGKIAEELANCYSVHNKYIEFKGIQGYTDISNPKKDEEAMLCSIVRSGKPRYVFVAFGSPQQEIWIDRHSGLFSESFVMGVGGAFDFLAHKVKRAPVWMRRLGLEWLYRLMQEPWRIKRQWRLPVFVCYVLLYKVLLILGIHFKGSSSR